MDNFDENIEYSEHEIFSNYKPANYVKKTFLLLIGLLTLEIALEVFSFLDVFSWKNLSDGVLLNTLVCFCFCSIFYIIWYYKINRNYWILSGQVAEIDYLGSCLFWFIPGLNIFVPYFRLKAIKSTYSKYQNKEHQSIFNSGLKIWAYTFLCFYYVEFYIVADMSFLPDDINFYYLEYPNRKLFDLIIIKQLTILGLLAMYSIVDDIQTFERNLIEDVHNPTIIINPKELQC